MVYGIGPYALDMSTKTMVHVSQVNNGLSCKCVCPACLERVVARQGSEKRWHFAHQKNQYCAHGWEMAIHRAMFERLAELRQLMVPSLKLPGEVRSARVVEILNLRAETISNPEVPDIVFEACGSKHVLFVTEHEPASEARLRRTSLGQVRAIGIRLEHFTHDFSAKNHVDALIMEDLACKKWVSHPEADFAWSMHIQREREQYLAEQDRTRKIFEQRMADRAQERLKAERRLAEEKAMLLREARMKDAELMERRKRQMEHRSGVVEWVESRRAEAVELGLSNEEWLHYRKILAKANICPDCGGSLFVRVEGVGEPASCVCGSCGIVSPLPCPDPDCELGYLIYDRDSYGERLICDSKLMPYAHYFRRL